MDVNSEQSNMKKILEKIISFFKLKIKKEPQKIEEVAQPQIKRLSYTKRTDT